MDDIHSGQPSRSSSSSAWRLLQGAGGDRQGARRSARDQHPRRARRGAAAARGGASSCSPNIQRKRKEAEKDAADIVAAAKREADMLLDEAQKKTEDYVDPPHRACRAEDRPGRARGRQRSALQRRRHRRRSGPQAARRQGRRRDRFQVLAPGSQSQAELSDWQCLAVRGDAEPLRAVELGADFHRCAGQAREARHAAPSASFLGMDQAALSPSISAKGRSASISSADLVAFGRRAGTARTTCGAGGPPARASRSRRGGARWRSPCGLRARSAGRRWPQPCIMRSRITLATIEAAAIDCERWSPLTSAWQSQGRPGGTSRPSASASARLSGRPASARRIASRLALQDVAAVDAFARRPRPSTTPSAVRRMIGEQLLALQRGQPLGIVEALGNAFGIEDHGRRDDRAGERSAAGLVEPGDRPQARRAIAFVSKEKSGFSTISKRGGESERGRAMLRRCSHRLRFSASPSRPLGRRSGKAPSAAGAEAGRDSFDPRERRGGRAAGAGLRAAISCSLCPCRRHEQVGAERRRFGVEAEPLAPRSRSAGRSARHRGRRPSCACPIPNRSPCRRASSGPATSRAGSGRDSAAAASP